jgi:hypothetical protein
MLCPTSEYNVIMDRGDGDGTIAAGRKDKRHASSSATTN